MHSKSVRSQRGTSLLETLVAVAICTVVMFSLAGLVTGAVKQNKNQGATVAQATTLAAQKLDQLLELTWTASDMNAGLTAGGSLTTDTTDYVDYLDPTGGTSVASTDARRFFTRRWLIEDQTGATSKKITVLVYGKTVGASSISSAPQATLACFKVQQ